MSKIMCAPVAATAVLAAAVGAVSAAEPTPRDGAAPAPWSFTTGADRQRVSRFFELFDRGSFSLDLDINDGTGSSKDTSVASLGYLRVRNGNTVRIQVHFAMPPGAGEALVTELRVSPASPIEIAPGLSLLRLAVLPDAKVVVDLERKRRGAARRETYTLEPAAYSETRGPVFMWKKPNGTAEQYRIGPDGGVEVFASQWTGLLSAGKRVQVIPLAHWPPTLSDLMSWLPKPKNTGTGTGQTSGGRRSIPVSRAHIEFEGDAAHVAIPNVSFAAIDDLRLRISATGLFEGATFHAGSPDDLGKYAETTESLNTAHATFRLPLNFKGTVIPLNMTVDGAWQATVPFYDLENVSAGFAFRANADSSFDLPELEDSETLLASAKETHLELRNIRGRTFLGRKRAGAAGHDLSFELDDTSTFKILVPGPIRLRIGNAESDDAIIVRDQFLRADDESKPVLKIEGQLASVKTGTGENAVRIRAGTSLSVNSSAPILVRYTNDDDHYASELAPDTRVHLSTGLSADIDFKGDSRYVEVLPSVLNWTTHLLNTTARNPSLKLNAPGRISASGELSLPRGWATNETSEFKAKAEVRVLDPGAALSMHLASMPAVDGALLPQTALNVDSGSGAACQTELSGVSGWSISTRPNPGVLTANLLVEPGGQASLKNLLSGLAAARLDLRMQLDYFRARNDPNANTGMLRFAGTSTVERKDPNAPPGLNTMLLPFSVFGRYGSDEVDTLGEHPCPIIGSNASTGKDPGNVPSQQ